MLVFDISWMLLFLTSGLRFTESSESRSTSFVLCSPGRSFQRSDKTLDASNVVTSGITCSSMCLETDSCCGFNLCTANGSLYCQTVSACAKATGQHVCNLLASDPICEFYFGTSDPGNFSYTPSTASKLPPETSRNFTKVLSIENRKVVSGSTSLLIDKINNGSGISVLIKDFQSDAIGGEREYMWLNDLNIDRNRVCGVMFYFNVSRYQKFMLACTNGKVTEIIRLTREQDFSRTLAFKDMDWFADGSAMDVDYVQTFLGQSSGEQSSVINKIKAGCDVRVITEEIQVRAVDLSEFQLADTFVAVRHPLRIDLYVGNAYMYDTIVSLDYQLFNGTQKGIVSSATWQMADGKISKVQKAPFFITNKWLTKCGWVFVYEINNTTNTSRGSFEEFMNYVSDGHRVKVVCGDLIEESESMFYDGENDILMTMSSKMVYFDENNLQVHHRVRVTGSQGQCVEYIVDYTTGAILNTTKYSGSVSFYVDDKQRVAKTGPINITELYENGFSMRLKISDHQDMMFFKPEMVRTGESGGFSALFSKGLGTRFSRSENEYIITEPLFLQLYEVPDQGNITGTFFPLINTNVTFPTFHFSLDTTWYL